MARRADFIKRAATSQLRQTESRVLAARSDYERDGVVCIRNAFSEQWIDHLRNAVDVAMENPGPYAEEYTPPGGKGRFFGDLELWTRLSVFNEFALESNAAGAVLMRWDLCAVFH
jgi:hypothetical protein